ncbi:hypothetical protein F0U59_26770 [Archangium gephyra]|nr:hypothetical protein F0U59_26770 [Archangium gephyra]
MPTTSAPTTEPSTEESDAPSGVDAILGQLHGVDVVTPNHPELLTAVAEAAEAPEPVKGTASAGASQSSPRARGAQCAPAGVPPAPSSAEAHARRLRRVRQNLRTTDDPAALSTVVDRAGQVGVSAGELEQLIVTVARERRGRAATPEGQALVEEWERAARVACSRLAAAPPVIEDVPAGDEEPAAEPPAPEAVLVDGIPVERVQAAAEPIAWWLKRLARLTQGTAFDLTECEEFTIFKGRGAAERTITGSPVTRLTELLAKNRAANVVDSEEAAEAPTWELAAYGVALAVALAPRCAGALKQAGALAHRGSISAARAAVRLVGNLRGRRR